MTTITTMPWKAAKTAAEIYQPLAGENSEELNRELAILVENGIANEFIDMRLEVAAYAFSKLQLYSGSQRDIDEYSKAEAAKYHVRLALREVGYNI